LSDFGSPKQLGGDEDKHDASASEVAETQKQTESSNQTEATDEKTDAEQFDDALEVGLDDLFSESVSEGHHIDQAQGNQKIEEMREIAERNYDMDDSEIFVNNKISETQEQEAQAIVAMSTDPDFNELPQEQQDTKKD